MAHIVVTVADGSFIKVKRIGPYIGSPRPTTRYEVRFLSQLSFITLLPEWSKEPTYMDRETIKHILRGCTRIVRVKS